MATSTVAVRQLSDQNSQGTIFGTTNDKIGFYGGATTAAGTVANGITVTTVIGGNYTTTCTIPSVNATTASVTTWAFASSTQANALIGLLDWAYRAGIMK